jgi:hypothetical protein
MPKQKIAADVAPHNEKKATDNNADTSVAFGYDPFNGEVYCFFDGVGYWIENWRSEHYSDYLHDADGNLITDEDAAIACHEQECANAHFSSPVYP